VLKSVGEVVSEAQMRLILNENGIKTGDVVMVHSSLSAMGYVEGGAEAVINALLKSVEEEGTILMPSFPCVGYNYDYLKKDPLFDVLNTPSKMGIISETFRKLPGVKRSLHPTDPVCVLGNEADYFVKDHFAQLVPYNKKSPFYKLIERNGKILCIGTQLETVTNFHTPEDAILEFKHPVYHPTIFTARLKDENGKFITMQTKVHNPEQSKLRKCNELEPAFLKHGIMTKFKIGKADCRLIDAKKMHEWLVEAYKRGVSMYEPGEVGTPCVS
jgi:aminoglycoside 3-N-acetyltransferase